MDIDVIFDETIFLLEKVRDKYKDKITEVAEKIYECFKRGNKLLVCGNGGSSADAQHISAEFVNRFRIERKPLPAIALTTDTSIITSIGNDYSFNEIFSKQVLALGKEGDVLLGISTSGRSKNVINALKTARELGLTTIGLSGDYADEMGKLCDHYIYVPSKNTPRIQEAHLLIEHTICELIDQFWRKDNL
ncbi:MAG: D-sedoheptulose 7-phosphate isomerase [Proteobacteria bacterium]|nr:D-sedoheptulose 7-phosphate isomerase [Pseudomonadota bacterium]